MRPQTPAELQLKEGTPCQQQPAYGLVVAMDAEGRIGLFVLNDPLRYTDPTGHYGVSDLLRDEATGWGIVRGWVSSAGQGVKSAGYNFFVRADNPALSDPNSANQLSGGTFGKQIPGLGNPATAVAGTVLQAGTMLIPGVEEEKAAGAAVKEGASILKNAEKGKAFEGEVQKTLEATKETTASQVTLETQSGVKTRIDFATKDQAGQVGLTEAKSSATAPLTPNQAKAFPEIEQTGATVKGAGKPGFPGGTQIPPTKVDIVRPNQ